MSAFISYLCYIFINGYPTYVKGKNGAPAIEILLSVFGARITGDSLS